MSASRRQRALRPAVPAAAPAGGEYGRGGRRVRSQAVVRRHPPRPRNPHSRQGRLERRATHRGRDRSKSARVTAHSATNSVHLRSDARSTAEHTDMPRSARSCRDPDAPVPPSVDTDAPCLATQVCCPRGESSIQWPRPGFAGRPPAGPGNAPRSPPHVSGQGCGFAMPIG